MVFQMRTLFIIGSITTIIVIILVACYGFTRSSTSSSTPFINSQCSKNMDLNSQFNNYLNEYNCNDLTTTEWNENYNYFQEKNYIMCIMNNNKSIGFNLSHNQFSIWSSSKWNQYLNTRFNYIYDNNNTINNDYQNVSISSTSIDWTSYTGPVLNQGACGSCFAEVSTELVQSYYNIKNNDNIQLSIEQIVDCDLSDDGCNGGDPEQALQYVKTNGGLCNYDSYPFTNKSFIQGISTGNKCEKCNVVSGSAPLTVDIVNPYNSDEALIKALQFGPVGIAITANATSFQLYSNGIYDDESCSIGPVNHAVMIVGFTDSYYLIKNSWSPAWGENGFMRIKRTPGDMTNGLCNILTYEYFITI